METVAARRGWPLYEQVHAIAYFTPDIRQATDAIGLKGGWMSYFATRSAVLGPAPANVVIATFYNFSPDMVRRAVPDAWGLATPEACLAARLEGIDKSLSRILGDSVSAPEVSAAAELGAEAAAAVDVGGRPLGAGNAVLPLPDEPHLRLWQAVTTLREHRGDGHVLALVDHEVDPTEALVMAAASGRVSRAVLQGSRKWTDEEWDAAVDRLAGRGWVTADGGLTDAGRAVRVEIERDTDRLAMRPLRALGEEKLDRFFTALRAVGDVVDASGGVARPNPIGAIWPPSDTIV
jgi:hypothetical protein